MRRPSLVTVRRILIDQAIFALALLICFWLRFRSGWMGHTDIQPDLATLSTILLFNAVWLVIFIGFGVYRRDVEAGLFVELLRVFTAVSLGVMLLLILTTDLEQPFSATRLTIFLYWILLMLGIGGIRVVHWARDRELPLSARLDVIFTSQVARQVMTMCLDLVMVTLAWMVAFYLRFDGNIPPLELAVMLNTLPIVPIIRISTFLAVGLYRGFFRYTGLDDLWVMVKGITLSELFLAVPVLLLPIQGFPRSVLVIDWLVLTLLIGGVRFAFRLGHFLRPTFNPQGRRVLILGAGDAGEMLLREMIRQGSGTYLPIGFLEDNPNKIRMKIHGVPVMAPIERLKAVVERYEIKEAIIAIPTATASQMRRIVHLCQEANVEFKTVPAMKDIIEGRVTVSQLREVRVEDLLGRDPVRLDTERIRAFLSGKRVLVTGAGGTIGGEICRQVLSFEPEALILLDRGENGLYYLLNELSRLSRHPILTAVVGDVRDPVKMRRVLAENRPQVIFHAAAHKHVPLMELTPEEAVLNNVMGTRNLALRAEECGVESFVMISTDKAVRPTSVMGVSKRVAEMFVQGYSETSRTRFVTVRFGNVLGSEGSVLILFRKQLAEGGPLTVTHPEVTRFFMTIEEAAQLVTEAGALGENGEIMHLDMGSPVKIDDLAKDLIRLSGLRPEVDIKIVYSGLRKGEKLYEELLVSGEGLKPTIHPKIVVVQKVPVDLPRLEDKLRDLERVAQAVDRPAVLALLAELVPSYQPPEERGLVVAEAPGENDGGMER